MSRCSKHGTDWNSECDECEGKAPESARGSLAAPTGSAWRDPQIDPPTLTGKILVWVRGAGPAIVNVEERWMSYWDGNDETYPADPDEWEAWASIYKPNDKLCREAGAKDV